MSVNAAIAIGEGVGMQAQVNEKSQITTGYWLVNLLMCAFPLTESYTQLLEADQWTYFKDSMMISNDPSMAATAAADYQKYQIDSSQMNLANGRMNTLIETSKGMVRSLGQNMTNIFLEEQPMAQLLKMTVNQIASFFR